MKNKETVAIKGLSLSVRTPEGIQNPLRQVSLSVHEGELLVILGESGAGKSLLVKALMGILPDEVKKTEGEILCDYEGRSMSLILQDPGKLLDPTMTIGSQIMESLKYGGVKRKYRKALALEILHEVSMDDPEKRFGQYVHELSGGLAQRAVMAVELAGKPRLLLLDEPTSALDKDSEEKIISLIMDMTRKRRMTTILITHSVKVAETAADRIAVMYAGKIVEVGRREEVLRRPVHPYTIALLKASRLVPDKEGNLFQLQGMIPSPGDAFRGDPFAERNPDALVIDHLEEPPLMKVTDTHYAASWLLDERYERHRERAERISI
ncbi:ABC transporter ATP-binding protein [Proteiniclasticum sp.]|uniref:ABC transporter ATP-binding protein n=1 Tax=Proteiniclasticum sp. TaxID=2053595 RepID=UPI0028A1F5F9|nr:ABC transporter ATP-binding protein [Proteiniclasticum sp.]